MQNNQTKQITVTIVQLAFQVITFYTLTQCDKEYYECVKKSLAFLTSQGNFILILFYSYSLVQALKNQHISLQIFSFVYTIATLVFLTYAISMLINPKFIFGNKQLTDQQHLAMIMSHYGIFICIQFSLIFIQPKILIQNDLKQSCKIYLSYMILYFIINQIHYFHYQRQVYGFQRHFNFVQNGLFFIFAGIVCAGLNFVLNSIYNKFISKGIGKARD